MIKILATVILLTTITITQVPWESSTQLKWKDFKGKPNKASKFWAMTNSGIKYSWSYTSKGKEKTFRC